MADYILAQFLPKKHKGLLGFVGEYKRLSPRGIIGRTQPANHLPIHFRGICELYFILTGTYFLVVLETAQTYKPNARYHPC